MTVVFIDELEVLIEVTAYPAPVYPMDAVNHVPPMISITTDPANLWDPETRGPFWEPC